ncbi:MAG TPA: ImmA/IrrE family metallo-endopeptidase [Herpetosiphonaceae bacterium]
MPAINPEILIWARETAGLSLEAAAHSLGFSNTRNKTAAEKLAVFESGEEEPSRQLLQKMSQRYRRSLLAFYLSAPPKRGDRGQDFRSVRGGQAGSDNALLDTLIRELKTKQSIVKSLLEDEEAEPLRFIGSMHMDDGAEAVAQSIQSTTGFSLTRFRAAKNGEDAFSYLRNRMEAIGIFVLLAGNLGTHHTAIPIEIFRGFAIADSIAPFVVVNDQDATSARCFTVLHEVVHLWLGTTGVSSTSTETRIEQFCNDVAGEVLLPTEELRELHIVQSVPLSDALAILNEFATARHISRAMVAYKLFRTGNIKEGKWRELDTGIRQEWEELQRQGKEKRSEGGPSYYVVRRHRLGPALLSLVTRSVNEGTLTPTKAGKVLGVKPRNVDPLLQGRSIRGEL